MNGSCFKVDDGVYAVEAEVEVLGFFVRRLYLTMKVQFSFSRNARAV
ncbi:hypothetical protein [Bacillus halotolerans]|nr:hypothetical protein [Bacillus halotolerans]MBV5122621.1 hypothetical protein [Bacillus halotolerans]MDG0766971.1 hypothetical protein [Bacillus halotolerans]